MLQKKSTLVVTFDVPVQAMAAEKYCLANGVPGRLIPVPREITAGRGLAWKGETETAGAVDLSGLFWVGTDLGGRGPGPAPGGGPDMDAAL